MEVLEITPNVDVLNPRNPELNLQEEVIVDYCGNVKLTKPKNYTLPMVASMLYDPRLFSEDVISSVQSRDGGTTLGPIELENKWNISDQMARNPIKLLTRLCPQNTKSILFNR